MKKSFPFRFFIVAFAWTWALLIPLMLMGLGVIPVTEKLYQSLQIPLIGLSAFGPGIAACYSMRTLEGKGSVRRYLRGLLDFRFGWRAWLFPVLIFGGVAFLSWILPEVWGAPRVGMSLSSIWLFPVYYLVMVLIGGGQEELGWRGYILDPMEERMGPWLANLVLGLVWAVWHLPLFFSPGTSQSYINFGGFLMLTVGYSYIFSWLRQLSGKRTMASVFTHGTGNVVSILFPTVLTLGGAQPRFWIRVSLMLLIGLIIMALRIRREKHAVADTGTGLRTA